ncbi:hypothetical protein CMI41_02385 [Candidatus Pacearchaeota archaeon]|nr:hypothetical protein [Candidatus Pacearchaeota archaeon]
MLLKKKPLHWPTLNTVIMVEETMKKLDSLFTVAELKRALPRQVNHNTLLLILHYLDLSNKIAVSVKGITWIHNPSPKLRKAIAEGMEI